MHAARFTAYQCHEHDVVEKRLLAMFCHTGVDFQHEKTKLETPALSGLLPRILFSSDSSGRNQINSAPIDFPIIVLEDPKSLYELALEAGLEYFTSLDVRFTNPPATVCCHGHHCC
jgi:hypothetical protein